MPSLKNNVKNISDDTETLVRDYLKLFSVRQSEKLAIFLGIMMSIFVIATLILILVIFCSFVMAGTLNKVLPNDFWGYVIVGSLYLLAIILLIVKIFKTETPLFTNLFVRLILLVTEMDVQDAHNIQDLRKEKEHIKQRIETDKTKIEADFQILRYSILGSVFKEVIGIFTSKRKSKPDNAKEPIQNDDIPDPETKTN